MIPLSQSKRDLAASAYNLAVSIGLSKSRNFPSLSEEICSAAMWGAICGAASYSEEYPWFPWCIKNIRGAIKDVIKSHVLHPMQSLSATHLLNLCTRDDVDTGSERGFFELLALLPRKHQDIVMLVYGQGLSPSEASRKLHYSVSYGCRLHREAIEILRQRLRPKDE